MSTAFYRVIRALARAFAFVLYPMRFTGAENIPEAGGVILFGNHLSLMDPIFVAMATGRPVRFMAKKELFVGPLGWLLRGIGAFPVDRGNADIMSVKTAIQILEGGQVLGIFPQGSRESKGGGAMRNGVSLIALRSGARLVPVRIREKARPFHVTHLAFGAPLDAACAPGHIGSADLQNLTAQLEKTIREL